MTGPVARPWPHVGRLRRLGPVVVVVALLVAAGVVATTRTSPSPSATSPGTGAGEVATSELPVTYQMAQKAGTVDRYRWVAGCDPRTGRLKMPSVYAPPCVPRDTGSNGGSTWPGVSAHTIVVVDYQAPPGDLTAELAGAAGTPATNLATAQGFVAMLNRIMPLYGRQVKLVPFNATGTSDDAVAGRADAITVADQLHAFASIGGPAQTPAYQDELARLHVLCISCGLAETHQGFLQDAPYLWGLLPAPDTLLTETYRYVIDQLNHHDAVWAGEPAFRHEKRVFAIVHYDQDPPVYGPITAEFNRELARAKVPIALQESYLLDIPELPSEAATIAAHLAKVGATTVVFIGDPIMPIYLTRACAALGYFPEWVISGTVFTDTSTLGRYYDQREWAHAFGISMLAVPLVITQSNAYLLYHWYYGRPPPAVGTAAEIYAPIQQLFDGVALAGPRLTPYSFRDGIFRLPPAGGGPTTPREAYGYQGAPPLPAYATPADYTFIWYDAAAHGTDEQGVYGAGMVRFVDAGKRYPATGGPSGPVPMFDPRGTVMQYAVAPPVDRPPQYPPWPGSPAARGR